MAKLELLYSLIYKGREYTFPSQSRQVEVASEGSDNKKISLNGTIHQNFYQTNLKLNFSWSMVKFDFCSDIQNLWNDYNLNNESVYLKREKPSGEVETFEVILNQPKIKLVEIVSPKEKWGSLEWEVSSKRCQNLSF